MLGVAPQEVLTRIAKVVMRTIRHAVDSYVHFVSRYLLTDELTSKRSSLYILVPIFVALLPLILMYLWFFVHVLAMFAFAVLLVGYALYVDEIRFRRKLRDYGVKRQPV